LCLRWVLVAGPLVAASAEQFVTHPCVVTRPPAGALLPRLDRLLGTAPLHEWGAVLILHPHPVGVVDEDVEVGAGLARRVDRLLGKMDGAVDVGERAGLLRPRGRGENDV